MKGVSLFLQPDQYHQHTSPMDGADFIMFYAGEATSPGYHPILIVEYYVS